MNKPTHADKPKINALTSAAAKNRIRQKWLMLVVFFVIAVIISFIGVFPASINLKEGDIAQENIVAPRRIVDTRMTEALKTQAESMTSPIYDYISSAKTEALNNIGAFFDFIALLDESAVNDTTVASYNSIYGVSLTADQYAALANLSTWSTNQLSGNLSAITEEAYAGEVIDSKLDEVIEALSLKIDDMPGYSDEVKTIAKIVLRSFVGPNMIVNEEATALAKEAARESVHEVVYETGQTIINMGEIVTAHQIQLLKDCGMIRTSLFENVGRLIGVPGLILVIMGMFVTYLYFYHYEIFSDNKRLLLLTTQIVLMLIIAMTCSYFSVYLIPISILTMSFAWFNARVAVQTNLFFMLLLGVTLQLDFDSVCLPDDFGFHRHYV
jgi:membrane-associated HD superfamily phosphohydrolase